MKKKSSSFGVNSPQALVFYICMVALPVLQFCVFYIGVNAYSLALAFQKYNPISGLYESYGLGNFKDFFEGIANNPLFKYSLKNSAILWLISQGICLPGGLILSYYLFKKYKLHSIFRVLLFIPSMIPSVVLVLVFQYTVVYGFPVIGLPNFMTKDSTKFVVALLYDIWVGLPGSLLINTSAMASTPKEHLEAAMLDGAGEMQQMWYIVFPHIYPMLSIFFATSLPGLLSSSGSLLLFFSTSVPDEASTMGYMLTRLTLQGDAGYPMTIAYGLVLTSISTPLVLIVRKLLRKYGPSED